MKLHFATVGQTTAVAQTTRRAIATLIGASLTALSLAFSHAAPASAGNISGTVSVTGSVENSCTIGSGSLTFGTDTSGDVAVTGKTTIRANCTLLTPATISMDTGLNSANAQSGSTRAMKYGSDFFSYDLYQNAAESLPWNTTGPGLLAFVGTGTSTTLNVYAKIPALQPITAGNGTYGDMVTATINY